MKISAILAMLLTIQVSAKELNPVEEKIPRMPSKKEAFKAIGGLDSDGDGVRDDIERMIYEYEPLKEHPKIRKALYSSSYWESKKFEACSKKASSDECLKFRSLSTSSSKCVGVTLKDLGVKDPSLLNNLHDKIYAYFGTSKKIYKLMVKLNKRSSAEVVKKHGVSKPKCIYRITL